MVSKVSEKIQAARLAVNNMSGIFRGPVAAAVNPLLDSLEDMAADIEKLKNPATPGKGGSHEG